MLTVALSQVSRHARRYIAVGLAVMLGVGFLAATLMVGATTTATLQNSIGAEYSKADLVVTSADGSLPPATADAVRSVAGVDVVHAEQQGYFVLRAGTATNMANLSALAPPVLEGLVLQEGNLPESDGQVVIDAASAEQLGVEVGDTVQGAALREGTLEENLAASGTGLTVTGFSEPSAHPFLSGAITLHAVPSQAAWPG